MFSALLRSNSRSATRAFGAVALVSLASAQSREARTEPTIEKRDAAAFLNREGLETLHTAFKPAHQHVIEAPRLTVAYDPKGAKLANIATQLGRPVDLKVKAIVQDGHAQAVVVEVVKATEDDDGGVPTLVDNSVPHVTISVSNAHDGYGPFYSNHMLSRALAVAGGFDKTWSGELPAKDGFEATKCMIVVPEERTILTATLCTTDQWKIDVGRCGEEKQCGFCRFMKMGPCGKEFAAWEECIDKCKETEDDFVDKCAHQTMTLKSCVDLHPEYYYSVIDEKDSDDPDDISIEDETGSAEASAAQVKNDEPLAAQSNTLGKIPATATESNETNALIEVETNARVEVDMTATVEAPPSPAMSTSSKQAEDDERLEDKYVTKG